MSIKGHSVGGKEKKITMTSTTCAALLSKCFSPTDAGGANKTKTRVPIKATLLCCVRGERVFIDTHDGPSKEEEEIEEVEDDGEKKTPKSAQENVSHPGK